MYLLDNNPNEKQKTPAIVIRRIFFHSLRVSFVTDLVRAVVALQTAQRLARHSEPRLTASVYTNLGDSDLLEAQKAVQACRHCPDANRATGTADQEANDARHPARHRHIGTLKIVGQSSDADTEANRVTNLLENQAFLSFEPLHVHP